MNKLEELREIYKKEQEQEELLESEESLYKITSISSEEISKKSINRSMTQVLLPFKVNYPKKLPRKSLNDLNTDSTLIVNYVKNDSMQLQKSDLISLSSDINSKRKAQELNSDMIIVKDVDTLQKTRADTPQEEIAQELNVSLNTETEGKLDIEDRMHSKKSSKTHTRSHTPVDPIVVDEAELKRIEDYLENVQVNTDTIEATEEELTRIEEFLKNFKLDSLPDQPTEIRLLHLSIILNWQI